ncbi:serine/threonine-protein kinase [Pseudonocardia sp. GCM10023141]|uniref:serine/threonine-protein kinase n=1 Tax=Pseudonocardia sp. GCM10023141 TaxID=3252653 RepID=UPI00361C57A9
MGASGVDAEPGPGLAARYELGELIGMGGTSTVYRARDRRLDRSVAVKIFTSGRSDHQVATGPEVRILAGLRHPGLVSLYDVGTEGGRPFLVMQLIEGEPLSQRIGRGPLPCAEAVTTGEGVAAALAHVHRHGVIHRDVKPANVLLDLDRQPYLADFGIARFVDATRATATGVIVGTPAYLAPEQVLGQRVGPAVDVYALGLVLVEGLTGTREYPGSPVESAVARLHRAPVVPGDVPAALRSLLMAMTDRDPALRPAAGEVATRLHLIADNPPLVVTDVVATTGRRVLPHDGASVLGAMLDRTAASTGRQVPWLRRHVRDVAAAGVAAVLGIGVLLQTDLTDLRAGAGVPATVDQPVDRHEAAPQAATPPTDPAVPAVPVVSAGTGTGDAQPLGPVPIPDASAGSGRSNAAADARSVVDIAVPAPDASVADGPVVEASDVPSEHGQSGVKEQGDGAEQKGNGKGKGKGHGAGD